MPTATAEEIAAIMLEALNSCASLWDALPEDKPTGNNLILAALEILKRDPESIC